MAESTLTPEQSAAIIASITSSGKTPPAKLEDLQIIRDPTTHEPIAYRDPDTGNTITIPAPKAPTVDVTSPAETTWVDISGPVQQGQTQQQQGHRIVNGQLQAIPGLTRAKPSDDKTGAPQWIPDPQDPNKEIQVVYSGTTALPVSANGAVVSRVKKAEPGAGPTAAGGARWIPDPSNPANEIEVVTILSPDGTPTNKPTGASRKAPATAPTAASNVIWQDIPDQPGKQQGGTIVDGKFQPITELVKDKDKKPVAVYGTGANDKFRITLDEAGNVVSQVPNDNYVGDKATQISADLVAPSIPLLKPDGTIQWVPNENRVMANDAMQALMDQAGLKVNAKQMSMADAKDLLTGAVNTMNAQTSRMTAEQQQNQTVTTAAGDILTNTRGNAQTGAGLLQQRVQSATGALQNILGSALGNKNFGAAGPIDPNIGTNLVQGLQGWTADLMGGQATLDSAARMVQAADPTGRLGNDATQLAIGTLTQMLDKHQELTGQPHPAVAATQAAQQSQQVNGMAAPGGYNPNDIQWNQPPQNAPGRTMGPGGVITGPQPVQAVAPIQPIPVASGFQAPVTQVAGQNYGAPTAYTGGIAPWLAQPQPAFVAPPMPQPLTPQMVLGGR